MRVLIVGVGVIGSFNAARLKEAGHDVSRRTAPPRQRGGVNLVAGFRPELWRGLVPDDAPPQVEGFNRDVVGIDGYVMPATQHDAVLWLSGSAYDVIFDMSREVIEALHACASVTEETASWPYRHDRDLTGFIDGTENPNLIDAPEIALIPEGSAGAGGTILLLQEWSHDATAWESPEGPIIPQPLRDVVGPRYWRSPPSDA